MREYNLYIAGYNIRIESAAGGPELIPSDRFRNYFCFENNPDIIIKVHSGKFNIPSGAEKVFDAPYVEDLNGIRIEKNDRFWSICKQRNNMYISAILPLSQKQKEAVLQFSLDKREWDLWLDSSDDETDPMEYPLDGLILYYLTVLNGDIMIHASGVSYEGRGYLFSGISGSGKSTMAKLWDIPGVKIIHDDRLIVRKEDMGYMMFNTPVYNNDEPFESKLDRIFIIDHGTENRIIQLGEVESVSLVMSNCIQHNWHTSIITGLLDSVSDLTRAVPAARFFFLPDKSAVDHILKNEKRI
jgi:hypothetical protein